MKAIDELKNEHRIIEVFLRALDHMAGEMRRGEPPHRSQVEKVMEVLRVFVDRCHHAKEERHLFPMLESRGMSREIGLLSEILHEHGQGRAHVSAMARTWTGAVEGDPQLGPAFAEHARGYARLLRVHIDKEDNKLFPLAEQTLSAEDDGALMEAFEAIEREEIGEGVHEKYHHWAEELGGGH